MKQIYISVSTDPVKEPEKIVEYAKKMQGKADLLHCDVMDGEFVENSTYGADLVYKINQNSLIMLDVHLMCNEPSSLIEDYLHAGANIITVHYEAFKDKAKIIQTLDFIKEKNALAGLSFRPETKVKDIKCFLYNVDVVLVMSVNPGASGQTFMPESLDKIRELVRLREENNFTYKIEVDGGVNGENAKEIIEAGADMLVSGSYVFKAENKISAIKKLKDQE